MKRIAKFQKVSYEQFTEGWIDTFGATNAEEIKTIYDHIKLPKRATSGSAGYDFYAPVTLTMKPGETVKVPTGIRVEMEENWVLKCYPRSGLGFKYRLQLNNTVGIIDSDYFYSDNEGHISQRSQMIQTKIKPLRFQKEQDLCRESLWNMESQLTMM